MANVLFCLGLTIFLLYTAYHMLRSLIEWLLGYSDWYTFLRNDYLPYNRWKVQHSRYLKTKHWREFSKAYRQKVGGCEVKGCVVSGWKNINVHHKWYNCLMRETENDVCGLCDKHHQSTHNGKDLVLKSGKVLKAYR